MYWVATGVATGVALFSAWSAAGTTWHRLNEEYRHFSAYSSSERLYAPVTEAGFPAELFAFFASFVREGDRVYFQVPRTPFGTLDLHDTVAALGRFVLLPAVETTDLEDATVVLSYEADPAALGRTFTEQWQYGSGITISRVAEP